MTDKDKKELGVFTRCTTDRQRQEGTGCTHEMYDRQRQEGTGCTHEMYDRQTKTKRNWVYSRDVRQTDRETRRNWVYSRNVRKTDKDKKELGVLTRCTTGRQTKTRRNWVYSRDVRQTDTERQEETGCTHEMYVRLDMSNSSFCSSLFFSLLRQLPFRRNENRFTEIRSMLSHSVSRLSQNSGGCTQFFR